MERLNLSLGSDECLLVVILLVRPSEDALRAGRVDCLLLQRGVVGVVEPVGGHVELRRVPLLERTDQLLLYHVDLLLALCELHLAVFEVGEVVTIDLLQVLHLAQKDELLLINDLLSLLLKHIILSELLFTLAHFSLLLLSIEALLKCIDLTLIRVESVSDRLDTRTLFLNRVTMITDMSLELLTIRAGLELDERLLLVNRLTLLLYSFFMLLACSVSISTFISILLLTISLSWLFSLLCALLVCALSGLSSHLVLLHLTESIWIGLNLSLDSFDILLRLAILHPDDRKDFTHLSK